MNRLISALAATSVLGIAAPAAAQSMQGMNMPGMTMPMPAKKKQAAKAATKLAWVTSNASSIDPTWLRTSR